MAAAGVFGDRNFDREIMDVFARDDSPNRPLSESDLFCRSCDGSGNHVSDEEGRAKLLVAGIGSPLSTTTRPFRVKAGRSPTSSGALPLS
jgi:hypothetical protein